ncbi:MULTISPECIES: hypothetical protein [unclassified Streptomyces]|uniref:hypothetical protein n=1 Tax=unclassified Streptomyces TaxID=2593676 RepID=UPI0005A9752D|nr:MULTISPECIES: hypothetical protein [unclassified Streptomyces]ODA71992.1 hypothetical protein APS67_003862 [Streptomyces sp. AVP053U2]
MTTDSNDCRPIDAARPPKAGGSPYAERVLCREPTEYPESYKGITMCPVCMEVPPVRAKSRTWGRQEAQRTACSG